MQYKDNIPALNFVQLSEFLSALTAQRPAVSPEPKRLIVIFGRETDTCFLFRTILEMWSYEVEEVGCLEDLTKLVETKRPELILMDDLLQFEKNLEDIRRIRQEPKFFDLPIILVSGFTQPEFHLRALAAGADDFLIKPVDFDVLENAVKKNLRKYFNKTFDPNNLALHS